jgi:hypothetical protein
MGARGEKIAVEEKATQQIAKLKTLVEAQRELLVKLEAIAVEIDEVLGGGPGIGLRMKELEATWRDVWASRYAGDYLFVPTKDRPQEKRLLKAFSVEELQARMWNYLKNDDPFYVRARHNFSVFVGSINTHAGAPSHESSHCPHHPVCQSFAACREKILTEGRLV